MTAALTVNEEVRQLTAVDRIDEQLGKLLRERMGLCAGGVTETDHLPRYLANLLGPGGWEVGLAVENLCADNQAVSPSPACCE